MQGDGDDRASKPSLVQLVGESPGEELPVLCLPNDKSQTCIQEQPQTPLPSSQYIPTIRRSEMNEVSDTSFESSYDLKCITLSSTPVHKASTPRDITMVTDSTNDWSVSMATPACLRQHIIGSTPVITTTDEETDIEGSLTSVIKQTKTLKSTDKNVVRTLFKDQCPASDGHHYTNTQMSHNRIDPTLFSPICASPLLCSHQRQTETSPTALQPNSSTSLISTHTIAETPTRLRKSRSEKESVGLNKGFFEEIDEQIMCSQELFENTEVFVEEECVNTIPDSPLVDGVMRSPAINDDDHTIVLESVPQSPAHAEQCTVVADDNEICDGHSSDLLVLKDEERKDLEKEESSVSTLTDPATHPPLHITLTNKLTTNGFQYPNTRHLYNLPHYKVVPRNTQSVFCARGKRKRVENTSLSPPEKKASLISSVAEDVDSKPTRDESLECMEHGSDSVSSGPAAQDVCQTGRAEQCSSSSVSSMKRSRAPGLRRTSKDALSSSSSSQQPVQQQITRSNDAPLSGPPLAGFATASGLSISISSRGLERAKQLMKEAADDSPDTTGASTDNITAQPPLPQFAGFQTASGRSLSISEKSIQKAHKLLSEDIDELDSKTTALPQQNTPKPQSIPATKFTALHTPAVSGNDSLKIPLISNSTGKLRGRKGTCQTKSFKAPRPASSVSKTEEEAKVAKILSNMRRAGAGMDSMTIQPPPSPCLMKSGFSTGSGRKLCISASSLQRAQQLVTEDKENGVASSPVTLLSPAVVTCGFKAASGHRVSVSTSALERAHSIFADINSKEISTDTLTTVVDSARAIDENFPVNSALNEGEQQSQSFYTKGIVKEDFVDFAAFTQIPTNHKHSNSGNEEEDEVTSAVNDSVNKEMDHDEDCSNYFSTQVVKQFLNFSTEVEEEELEDGCQLKQGNILHSPQVPSHTRPVESPTTNANSSLTSRVTESMDLSTATITHDNVSSSQNNMCQNGNTIVNESLMDELFGAVSIETSPQSEPENDVEHKPMMPDCCVMDCSEEVCTDVCGLSASVVERLTNIEGVNTTDDSSIIASTDDGNKGTVEDVDMVATGNVEDKSMMEAVEDVDSICNEDKDEQSKEPVSKSPIETLKKQAPHSFPGLMTASGKKIDVSLEALSAAKETLNSGISTTTTDNQMTTVEDKSPPLLPINTSFPGFQTAGGKRVEISEESLKFVRHHIQSDTAKETVTNEATSMDGSTMESVFTGLQTAAGAKVDVLQSSLAAVKQDTTPTNPSISQEITVRMTPQFKPLSMQRTRSHTAAITTSSSNMGRSVRYKPVFRSHQHTEQIQSQPSLSTVMRSDSRNTSIHGVHSTPEGVLCDRVSSRRPLIPMQTYLGPDGSYISTPVQRYNLRRRGRSSRSIDLSSHSSSAVDETRDDVSLVSRGRRANETGCSMIRTMNNEYHVIEQEDTTSPIVCDDSMKCIEEKMQEDGSHDTNKPSSLQQAAVEIERDLKDDSLSGRNEGQVIDSEEVNDHSDGDDDGGGGGVGDDGGGGGVGDGDGDGDGDGVVCAVEQLNDSLDEVIEEDETTIPFNSGIRTSTNHSTKTHVAKLPPHNAGSLLRLRLQYADSRISLATISRCRVPGRYTNTQLYTAGVHPTTVAVNAENAAGFQFSGEIFFSSAVLKGAPVCVGDDAILRLREGKAGSKELYEAFITSPGVDKKLVSFAWFVNHYQWIVWKLAAMEVSFPVECAGQFLTPDWLMKQMRYCYDREIEAAERSALHRICERDDVSTRRLALCVSAVYPNIHPSTKEDDQPISPSLQVTDGWYSLPAVLDPPLRYMVNSGRITVGTKLLTYGAELVGSTDPCHPLEAPSSLCLRLSANSTRRARWYTRLGYQPCPRPFNLSLTSLFPDGGTVGCTEAVIARVYPILYMEKLENGKNIFRNGRAEERASRVHQKMRQRKIETISCRIQQEFEEEIARQDGSCGVWRRSRRLNTVQVKQLQDGETIHSALTNSPDPQAFQEALSRMQHVMLESYRQNLLERRQAELRNRIEEAVRKAEEDGAQLPHSHTSIPLLRVRLIPPGVSHTNLDCKLSIWRPREDVRSVLVESKVVRLWNVNTSSSMKNKKKQLYRSIQMAASKYTRFELVAMDSVAMETALMGYCPRECVTIRRLVRGEGVWFGEVDTVGIVVCVTTEHVEPSINQTRSKCMIDTVYVADEEQNLMAIRLWDGLEHHALHDLITPSSIISVTSLTYRGPTQSTTSNHTLTIASDHTHFSRAPSEPHMREGLQQLKAELPSNIQKYVNHLKEEVMNIHLPLHHNK